MGIPPTQISIGSSIPPTNPARTIMLGLAFSGGGITGIIGSICALNAVLNEFPAINKSGLVYSTSSGGTIGVGLMANIASEMSIPAYSANMTYAAANTQVTSADKPHWYGNVINYLPSDGTGSGNSAASWRAGNTSGWWTKVIDLMFWEGYGVHDYDITAGDVKWLPNFGLLSKSGCPISRSSSGVMKNAESDLQVATADMSTMSVSIPSGAKLVDAVSTLEVMSYSSSFWVAGIVESKLEYALGKGSLQSGETDDGTKVYFTDGGMIDTTGIVAQLQQRTEHIIAFYNNNDNLEALNSTIAYLFGVAVDTDSQNAVEGPTLDQVFDSSLYNATIANLTDPSILRAMHVSLAVRDNAYLGVKAYTVSTLMILSNQYSDDFLDTVDSTIKGKLSTKWPNSFPISMGTLDANMLCTMQGWKVQRYASEINAVVEGAK